VWLWATVAAIGLDQWSKAAIEHSLPMYGIHRILPVFELTRLHNPGAAFNFLAGASGWQRFRYITWPSLQTLYLTSTILSMIWTLGDFNSVYLLTGGGPADLTHVLATLGIRYLRLDQVDLAMASIVCALPCVLPLVLFMMRRLSK